MCHSANDVTPSMARWMTHSSKGPAFAYSTISVRSCQNGAPPATRQCIEQDGSRWRLKHGMQYRNDGRQIGSARQRVGPRAETQGVAKRINTIAFLPLPACHPI